MADNYLEKRMEEHRAGAGRQAFRPRLTPRGRRPGELVVEFTPCPVVIRDIETPGMTGVIRELVAAGFKVCFTMADIHRATRLASTLGATFLPEGMPEPEGAITLAAEDGRWTLRRGGAGLAVTLPMDDKEVADDLSPLSETIAWGAAMLANLNDFQEKVFKNIKIEGLSF